MRKDGHYDLLYKKAETLLNIDHLKSCDKEFEEIFINLPQPESIPQPSDGKFFLSCCNKSVE
jgi:hypothetical protein